MKIEIFKTIEDYEDYQVSNTGRVISNKGNNSKFLKPQKDKLGYYHVRLYGDKSNRYADGNIIPKLEKVHRLVALTFIPKPDSQDIWEVNHKDGNKDNNDATNLEWVTRRQNIQHSWDTGLRDNAALLAAPKRYKACKVTTDTGEVLYYQSRKHAALDLDITTSIVCYFIRTGKSPNRGQVKGYFFEDCPELPPSQTFKQVLNLEQKLLEYKKVSDYFRQYAKNRRKKLRNE